ncbi:MAG TPA: hypothetical protein VIL30_18040 [Ramlibacter sp.]|jgi:hypothetical protein
MMFVFPTFSPTHAVASAVTMVAGSQEVLPGATVVGYNASGIGSLSSQPIPGQTMLGLAFLLEFGQSSAIFQGDIAGLLNTLTLYVDDVAYPLADANPTYSEIDNETSASWSDLNGPQFANGVSYAIRIE